MKTLAEQWAEKEKLIDESPIVLGQSAESVDSMKQFAKFAWLDGVNVGIESLTEISRDGNKRQMASKLGVLKFQLNSLLKPFYKQ